LAKPGPRLLRKPRRLEDVGLSDASEPEFSYRGGEMKSEPASDDAVMRRKKALSVVGARPNFVKLAPVHRSLVRFFGHVIVHTGQHYDYEMSKVFFQNLGLPNPDYNLGVGSGRPGHQIGRMVIKLERIFLREKPGVVLVYGDVNSTLAGALAAAKLCIPVAHVEAGLRSFDMHMPEEVNRVVTDHISDYLFAPSQVAVGNLRRESCPGRVSVTGDVMAEVLRESIGIAERESHALERLGIASGDFVLATVHRAENTEDPARLSNIVRAMTTAGKKIVFPVHPRTTKALRRYGFYRRLSSCGDIMMTRPLGYFDFIKLEKHAEKILTDSGGVQREAYLLGVPCITLRENTEWLETLRGGWNVLAGVDVRKTVQALRSSKQWGRRRRASWRERPSEKIAAILRGSLN